METVWQLLFNVVFAMYTEAPVICEIEWLDGDYVVATTRQQYDSYQQLLDTLRMGQLDLSATIGCDYVAAG